MRFTYRQYRSGFVGRDFFSPGRLPADAWVPVLLLFARPPWLPVRPVPKNWLRTQLTSIYLDGVSPSGTWGCARLPPIGLHQRNGPARFYSLQGLAPELNWTRSGSLIGTLCLQITFISKIKWNKKKVFKYRRFSSNTVMTWGPE